jgi:hypothetical protein
VRGPPVDPARSALMHVVHHCCGWWVASTFLGQEKTLQLCVLRASVLRALRAAEGHPDLRERPLEV